MKVMVPLSTTYNLTVLFLIYLSPFHCLRLSPPALSASFPLSSSLSRPFFHSAHPRAFKSLVSPPLLLSSFILLRVSPDDTFGPPTNGKYERSLDSLGLYDERA
jgi:hypothetical protein